MNNLYTCYASAVPLIIKPFSECAGMIFFLIFFVLLCFALCCFALPCLVLVAFFFFLYCFVLICLLMHYTEQTCPNSCSSDIGQGACINNTCVCSKGYFWIDCSRGLLLLLLLLLLSTTQFCYYCVGCHGFSELTEYAGVVSDGSKAANYLPNANCR
jgi:hypothetical protein